MRKFRNSKGATLVEYALCAGILVAVFAVAAVYLTDATNFRVDQSSKITEGNLPCEVGLIGDQCM